MPNYDRTGPCGEGPMTGRRAGSCAGYAPAPGGRRGGGFGGRRRGGGFGRCRGFGGGYGAYAVPDHGPAGPQAFLPDEPLSPDERRQALKTERNRLKAALGSVEGELKRMGAPDKNEP